MTAEATERLPNREGGGGAPTKKGNSWRKKVHLQMEISKRKFTMFLDIVFYPYIVITLSGMSSIFVSFYTS